MENNKAPVVSVSQVNRAMSLLVKNDRRFSNMAVKGEVCNFSKNRLSGHVYFSLCDENSTLKAVMWANNAEKLSFLPKDGDKVVCFGGLCVYEAGGNYELVCAEIKKDGEGEQAKALLELAKKLEKEGLFSRKRPLVKFPKKIAVITSPDGAALQDILNILSRRFPAVRVCVIPATVQGANAPASVVKAFERVKDVLADVVIFGRGGGSAEDLSAFNAEEVARAVFACPVPTISAVGHEVDTTIADLAADLRAPTPSAAAELAVPDKGEVKLLINSLMGGIKSSAERKLSFAETALFEKTRLINALSPRAKIDQKSKSLEESLEKISREMKAKLSKAEAELQKNIEVISALSPDEVFKRGYSAVLSEGKAVTQSSALKVGDRVELKFKSGAAMARIEEIIE